MKRMDMNEQRGGGGGSSSGSGSEQAGEEIGLRRVEALLRASADWEPDSPAPAGLAWDALRARKTKAGFAGWAASLIPSRPALIGVGASAALAAGAAFLWFAAAGGNGSGQRLNARVSDAAINAAI